MALALDRSRGFQARYDKKPKPEAQKIWGQPSSPENIAKLVKEDGLKFVIICEKGIGRSFAGARDMSSAGKPAVCLRGGGVGELSLLASPAHPRRKQLDEMIDNITEVETVIFFLSAYEIQVFQPIIAKIAQKLQDKGHKLIFAPDLVEFYNKTNVLVDL
jgi:hypothetical protein